MKQLTGLYTSVMASLSELAYKASSSRKYMAWMIASVALFTDFITPEHWITITVLYIGVQGGLDWKKTLTPTQELTIEE